MQKKTELLADSLKQLVNDYGAYKLLVHHDWDVIASADPYKGKDGLWHLPVDMRCKEESDYDA